MPRSLLNGEESTAWTRTREPAAPGTRKVSHGEGFMFSYRHRPQHSSSLGGEHHPSVTGPLTCSRHGELTARVFLPSVVLSTPANNSALPGNRVTPWDRAGCAEPAAGAGSPHSPVHSQEETHHEKDRDLGQQSQTQENLATAARERPQHILPELCCSFVGHQRKLCSVWSLLTGTHEPGKCLVLQV